MHVRGRARPARIAMKVLLVGATGTEPSFQAWRLALDQVGVPFEAIALARTGAWVNFSDTGQNPRFQGVILATGALFDEVLTPAAREELEALECRFGIRRLTAYAVPGPVHGLRPPTYAGALDQVSAGLTAGGRRVFPYLRGPLPMDPGSWGYLAAPVSPERFEALVVAADGSALVGIHRRPDGREEMIQTFDANAGQAQAHLLRPGQLAWLTRGAYLGHRRSHLSLQIDDVLLGNHRWDSAGHAVDRNPGAMIRMTPQDATHAADWAHSRRLRLDLVGNGAGSERHAEAAGLDADPLLRALLARRDEFGWINHTYEHRNLDTASQATIEAEIAGNRRWADRVGITLEPGALITGAHTGLANLAAVPPQPQNPHLAPALAAQGVRFLGCDASRPHPADALDPVGPPVPRGEAFTVGPALAVPRHPTALGYAAATPAQALDQARHQGLTESTSWRQLVDLEAARIFAAVMSNDPCPHYFHQSNLASGNGHAPGDGGRVFYTLIDAVLALYQRYMSAGVPLVQPTLSAVGEMLTSRAAWKAARQSESIVGYVQGEQVVIVNRGTAALDLPVTGTSAGSDYAGTRSGWIRVPPGETVLDRCPPDE
jgi:hypothetical protein